MTALPERLELVTMVRAAHDAGARLGTACTEAGLSVRTYERWIKDGEVGADGRPEAERPEPSHKLTAEERARVMGVCHEPRFADLPPSQIVPRLADEGTYLASEASFYRLLRAADEQQHRGRAAKATASEPPRPSGHRTEQRVGMGHYLPCQQLRDWSVLLPVRDPGPVEPQDRGLGSA
jgi:hypothetical protein